MKKYVGAVLVVGLILAGYFLYPGNDQRDVESLATLCTTNGGKWDLEYLECIGLASNICEDNGGVYNDCGSVCRHSKIPGMACIAVCQRYCAF